MTVPPDPEIMTPPIPEGFTDQTAWDVIHWKFSENGTSTLDQLVIDWQRNNQDRVHAAIKAEVDSKVR